MSKCSGINVGSIEEDIRNLEKYIELVIDKNYCDCNELNIICYGKYADGSKNVANSIQNILQDYTRQKQINEEHQKINGELREKVKELEEQVEYDKTHIYTPMTIQLNFIPKQKIKDKIEELNKQRRELGFKTYLRKEDIINDDRVIVCQIQVLQKLLQESEDK